MRSISHQGGAALLITEYSITLLACNRGYVKRTGTPVPLVDGRRLLCEDQDGTMDCYWGTAVCW